MKTENFLLNSFGPSQQGNFNRILSNTKLTSDNWRRQHSSSAHASGGLSDKDSICSGSTAVSRGKRYKIRSIPMKSTKGVSKKSKTMDYTNYAYNEAVGRLKLMLADSYSTPKGSRSYFRDMKEDSTDNYSDNMSVIERPVFSDISKYLSPSQKTRFGSSRPKKTFATFSSSKENLAMPSGYQKTLNSPLPDYYVAKTPIPTDSVQAPVEIFNFIEKQEDYIEQLEKESKYCRNELSNLLGKVKDVIQENEHLTENTRSELVALAGKSQLSSLTTSPSSDSDELMYATKKSAPPTPTKKKDKSPRYASAPNIVYEARISELEAELMQSQIDLKRLKNENEDLKKKLSNADPLAVVPVTAMNCETHRKQIEHLQMEKNSLEETIRHLQKCLDEAKSQQYNASSKRYIKDLVQMERSQAELEVKNLRDELDRQHERVRELQHETARRIAEERANAERRYNNQVDQLGGDLSNQWEQVAKLQLDLERQKRYESDLKRDLANRNAQIEELKMELRSNRSTFLADMAQVSAEKQSLEQEITSLRLQLDRSGRENKTEAARLNAEINSLRQRLDRADADLLHSKREVLRLNDEIANLEKELAYGEMKNEIRPTKKDLDKRISEMQEKHAETVNELEDMIQNQKQLMDKLTGECKLLTNKLEDTTLKHKAEISSLQSNVEYLTTRMFNNERLSKYDTTPTSYNSLPPVGKASLDYTPTTFSDPATTQRNYDDEYKQSIPYTYEPVLGKTSTALGDAVTTSAAPTTTATASYEDNKYERPTDPDRSFANSSKSGNIDNNDYKSGYNYDINDDENLKDNIGAGEKQSGQSPIQQKPQQQQQHQPQQQQQQQQQQQEQQKTQKQQNESLSEAPVDTYKRNYELNTGYPAAGEATLDSNVANLPSDYNTDYTSYGGYEQQQYDPSLYDSSAYNQQYNTGMEQYDTSGQLYGTEGTANYDDYNNSNFDTNAYQYKNNQLPSVPIPPSAQQAAINEPQSSKTPTASTTGASSTIPTASATSSYETSSTAPTPASGAISGNLTGAAATSSRPQPRASTSSLGPSTTGPVTGGKSILPQQSSSSATTKK